MTEKVSYNEIQVNCKIHFVSGEFLLLFETLYCIEISTYSGEFFFGYILFTQLTRITYTEMTYRTAAPNFNINIWKFKNTKYQPTW